MILPQVPAQYSPSVETERNRSLRMADQMNRKVGQDVEVGAERLILTSPDGERWSVTVDNTGALSTTLL